MAMTNRDRIGKALDLLRDGIRAKCEETWLAFLGDDWLQVVNLRLHHPQSDPSTADIQFLFSGMKVTWGDVFGQVFSPVVRSWVFDLAKVRNEWAHQQPLASDDVLRALDTMERLLGEFGDTQQRQAIKKLRRELMQQMFAEEARAERRKTASKSTEGQPQAGLAPWRDVITPHEDVASGRFDQAEFAADLYEVANGDADDEYGDPRAFFARTYLTNGLRDLLVGAARRLSGGGGDPVIELQTNFGGGKTHSLIALYHLASGVPAQDLAGVADALAAEDLALPENISRAVLVGQKISPARVDEVENGVRLHTLWGRLAYQLGGKDGYELVRADDENGTNPGAALKELFERHGPAVVLIDEWVAYARQLRDVGDGGRLAGGDFDTQFTFAQQLTEAAAAVENVVVLVTIPASDIEVGGEHGKTALVRLKNVVARTAAQWQQALPDESFEIVRRRLFDPIAGDKVRVRDSVVKAFGEMYRNQVAEFPPSASEREFQRRLTASYPFHPELFDRLFGEWSTLDKFQRTRGVLRLMALAIAELWQRGDQSALIMPGNLPMDHGPLVSEMKKYLEDGWDPVIKSDVDGENSLPLKLDNDNRHFGQLSATRRVARSVYMGSAAKPDQSRGIDLKHVVLGCAQPGEPVAQFADALKRLSGEATHLYVDGAQYWYSLQPNVTRLAADRASSDYEDRDADDEVSKRVRDQRDRGSFVAIQVFAEGPGDVPDDDDGVRLVVLHPGATHSRNDEHSPARDLASSILAQRDSGPRLNRNLLVFAAADATRLPELREAARLYLAWTSIVDDDGLDLTGHQQQQAVTTRDHVSQQVNSLIAETFVHVLSPSQEPGTSEVDWHTTRAAAQGDLGARVSKKLASEEKLIAKYAGVRVKMDIDRYKLWSDRHDLAVGELWSNYARFPHLPRLASFQVLAAAIGNGTANLTWKQETFGYADAHDGEKWLSVKTAEHVSPERSGLLIHPDHVPEPVAPDSEPSAGPSASAAPSGADDPAKPADVAGPTPSVTRFYSHFALDPVRMIKELGDISENVVRHLGPDVELSLEVRATSNDGFDDATQRTVSENATNLGANTTEFE